MILHSRKFDAISFFLVVLDLFLLLIKIIDINKELDKFFVLVLLKYL